MAPIFCTSRASCYAEIKLPAVQLILCIYVQFAGSPVKHEGLNEQKLPCTLGPWVATIVQQNALPEHV